MAKPKPQKKESLNPYLSKSPRKLQEPTSYYDKNFSWRVHDKYIDCDHPKLGWSKIYVIELLKFIIKGLHSYEGLTWREVNEKKSCHPWDLDKIPAEFFDRLQERQIDVDEIFQISLGSLPRVFGNRDRAIFYLIWYDPDHQFWPTEP